jgi:hypothetical protein
MEAIYVLSDPDTAKLNKYKIGITTRNKEKLLRDYRRSRPEVELYLFEQCSNSKLIEEAILTEFYLNRINHESGKPSEWLIVDLNLLLKSVKFHVNRNKPGLQSNQLITTNDTVLYKVDEFVHEKCQLYITCSESCQNLYQNYAGSNNKNKLTYLSFCRALTQFLSTHYNKDKKDLKYKYNKLIYYRGISLNTGVPNYCTII